MLVAKGSIEITLRRGQDLGTDTQVAKLCNDLQALLDTQLMQVAQLVGKNHPELEVHVG